MDFDDTPTEATFRSEVRDWLQRNAPTELYDDLLASCSAASSNVELPRLSGVDAVAASKAWQSRKYHDGWTCLTWPKEFGGRSATAIEQVIWQQEEGLYAQLSDLFAVGHGMAGPTILEHGTEDQRRRYLKPIASGEEVWCQLFSEPAGGSDLAGLRSSAKRTKGGFIVNGQKIWTTHAQIADFGLLLVRTDPDVPKHYGLTMLMLDMASQGIDIRPIMQITGARTFNEVFMTDTFVPDEAIIGGTGRGWQVALTTLMNERLRLAATVPTGVPELLEYCRTLRISSGPALRDPAIRGRLASWLAKAAGLRFTMMRTISALSQGHPPGPESSIGKLVAGDIVQDLAAFALDLQGPAGAIMSDDTNDGRFQRMLLSSAKVRIGGGTAEIQRNIIAERVLGLPPDVRVDKSRPFRELDASPAAEPDPRQRG